MVALTVTLSEARQAPPRCNWVHDRSGPSPSRIARSEALRLSRRLVKRSRSPWYSPRSHRLRVSVASQSRLALSMWLAWLVKGAPRSAPLFCSVSVHVQLPPSDQRGANSQRAASSTPRLSASPTLVFWAKLSWVKPLPRSRQPGRLGPLAAQQFGTGVPVLLMSSTSVWNRVRLALKPAWLSK